MSIPLAVFDFETTNADPATARVVQCAVSTYEDAVMLESFSFLCNPQETIEQGAMLVHGITNERVSTEKPFLQYIDKLHELLHGRYWVAYNGIHFDLPILLREFSNAKLPDCLGMIDPYKLFLHYKGRGKKGERTLRAAHIQYLGKDFENSHDAMSDVAATHAVLAAMRMEYKELEDVSFLLKYSSEQDYNIDFVGLFRYNYGHVPCVGKGKFAGMPMNRVPVSFYKWVIQGGFPSDTKRVAKNAMMGIFPVNRT